MADVKRIGFAQVEPNHLSGIVTGQIYAQYPADTATMGTILEQGRFAKYDGQTNKVNLSGKGEWMLIYNEEKLPDPRKQAHKDFALKGADYTYGEITPRLVKTNVGDIYTTNAINAAGDMDVDAVNALTDITEATYAMPAVGTILKIDTTTGYLAADGDDTTMEFQVIKPFAGTEATMPDGQPAVKVMRIK